MALRTIVKLGHPLLRRHTEPVAEIDDNVRRLVEDMIETMDEAEGIGLAAPQVAESISVLVVNNGLIEDGADPKAYINPAVYENDGADTMEEGCLSIPDVREDVARPETIKLTYLDIDGKKHDETCSGMLARVLQHEIDHLNGVLFIDRISQVKRQLLAKRLKQIAAEGKAQWTGRGDLTD